MWSEGSARSVKRQARAAMLMEEVDLDRELLRTLAERYNLSLPSGQ
jgi:hypothetical protein